MRSTWQRGLNWEEIIGIETTPFSQTCALFLTKKSTQMKAWFNIMTHNVFVNILSLSIFYLYLNSLSLSGLHGGRQITLCH